MAVKTNLKIVDRFCQPFSSNTSKNKGVSHALATCVSGRFVDNLCARRPRVSLDHFLERNNLTTYKLTKEVVGKASQGSVYARSRGNKVKRVNLGALTRLTGQTVTPNGLLEVIETPAPLETADSETQAW